MQRYQVEVQCEPAMGFSVPILLCSHGVDILGRIGKFFQAPAVKVEAINMTGGIWWMCFFLLPVWMAWFDIIVNKIHVAIFFALYAALICWGAKFYFQFELLDVFLFDWIFAFSGCMAAFIAAKNIPK